MNLRSILHWLLYLTSPKRAFVLFIVVLFVMSFAKESKAGSCSDSFLNMPTEIAWECVFPITIGGVVKIGGGATEQDNISDPICACGNANPVVGLTASFWEPARVIDTVRDAWCMNAIGTQLSNPSPGKGGGSLSGNSSLTPQLFAQMHYYKFPVWAMLDLFTDLPCTTDGDRAFDIALMSELLPNWNNPILALLLNPEALVFGNPIAKLACVADSVAAALGNPIDQLFWCMGSWGSPYPFTGSTSASDPIEANAAIAARAIYMAGRTGLLLDPAVDACGSVPTPIWKKSHYKIQLMRPIRDYTCRPIGMTGTAWTFGKNPIIGEGNYSWMVFRKNKCCVGYGL